MGRILLNPASRQPPVGVRTSRKPGRVGFEAGFPVLLLVGLLGLFSPGSSPSGSLWAQDVSSSQERSRALQGSADEVAAHWARGSASGLSDLLARGGIGFHTPTGGQAALDSRKAAAALEDLLNRNPSVSCTVVRVTLASGASDRGSAELAWESTASGTSEVIRRTVFVGFSWEDDGWRIYEIRILPA